MRKNIIFLAVVMAGIVHAQETTNQLGLEIFQPIKTDVSDPINSEQGAYLAYDGFTQKASGLGVGVLYQRKMKNSWDIRFRPGLFFAQVDQHLDYYYELEWDSPTSLTIIDIDGRFISSHTGLNLGVGLLREERISDRFSFFFGTEILGNVYFRPSFQIDEKGDVLDKYNGGYSQSNWIYNLEGKLPGRYGIVIVPVIYPSFRLTEALSMSLELQTGFLFSSTFGETTYEQSQSSTYSDGFNTEQFDYEYAGNINTQAKSFGWSKLSPILRFSYSF